MNPAEAAMCARDPGLALALAPDDAELLAWCVRGWRDGAPPVSARVRYLRYKPDTLVLATVDLAFADGGSATAALSLAGATAAVKIDKTLAEAAARGAPALVHDPARRAVLLPLRADRALRGLAALGTPGWLGGIAEPHVLAYKPGRRAVLRVTRPDGSSAVLRLYTRDGSAAPHRNLAWSDAVTGSTTLLAYDRRNDALLVRWVAGTPATGVSGAAAAGAAAARFHHRPVAGLVPVMPPTAADLAAGVADLDGDLGVTAAALLAGRPPAPLTAPATPVHGDLAPAQVIVGTGVGGATLIDLDRAGTGDPARDPADWIAAWIAGGAPVDGSAGGPADPFEDPAVTAFLDAYRAAGGPAEAALVRAHLPAALLARVPGTFRTRLPDWPARAAHVVATARRIAAETVR